MKGLPGAKVFGFYPFLSPKAESLESRFWRPIPIAGQYDLQFDFAKRLVSTISSWFLPTDEQFEQIQFLLEELVKAQKAPT